MDLKELSINTRNWVDSAQDGNYWRALVNAAFLKSWSKLILIVECSK